MLASGKFPGLHAIGPRSCWLRILLFTSIAMSDIAADASSVTWPHLNYQRRCQQHTVMLDAGWRGMPFCPDVTQSPGGPAAGGLERRRARRAPPHASAPPPRPACPTAAARVRTKLTTRCGHVTNCAGALRRGHDCSGIRLHQCNSVKKHVKGVLAGSQYFVGQSFSAWLAQKMVAAPGCRT